MKMASRGRVPSSNEWDLGRTLSVITLIAVPFLFGLAIGAHLGSSTQQVVGYMTLTQTVTETVQSMSSVSSIRQYVVSLQCDQTVSRGDFFKCIVSMQYQFEVVMVNMNVTITDPDGVVVYTNLKVDANPIMGEAVTWFVPKDSETGTYTFSVTLYGVNSPVGRAATKFDVT